MVENPPVDATPELPASRVFGRVVVGVDGTPKSFEACRQVAALAEPEAAIEAVAVVHLADTANPGGGAPPVADELQRDAEQALEEAVRILGPRARPRFVNGFVAEALLREVEQAGAGVVAIGSHGHHRATEIMIGGVAGELLHEAPCSVLVARPPSRTADLRGPIVVGLDGSSEGEAALAAARELAARLGVALRVVVASRGKQLDLARVHSLAPGAEEIAEHPLAVLLEASRDAALVVVGSRGLHGLRALGSVSERVAYQAACSVLVVRAAPDA